MITKYIQKTVSVILSVLVSNCNIAYNIFIHKKEHKNIINDKNEFKSYDSQQSIQNVSIAIVKTQKDICNSPHKKMIVVIHTKVGILLCIQRLSISIVQ